MPSYVKPVDDSAARLASSLLQIPALYQQGKQRGQQRSFDQQLQQSELDGNIANNRKTGIESQIAETQLGALNSPELGASLEALITGKQAPGGGLNIDPAMLARVFQSAPEKFDDATTGLGNLRDIFLGNEVAGQQDVNSPVGQANLSALASNKVLPDVYSQSGDVTLNKFSGAQQAPSQPVQDFRQAGGGQNLNDLYKQSQIANINDQVQRRQEGDDLSKKQNVEALEGSQWNAGRVQSVIDDASGLVTGNSTGLTGAVMSRLPGTDSHKLAKKIETLEANLGIDELLRVKREGGAFGALSEKELMLLQQRIANLDQIQDPNELKIQLQVVHDSYQRIADIATSELGGGVGPDAGENTINGQAGGGNAVNSQQEYDALPSGATYTDAEDGKQYRKP